MSRRPVLTSRLKYRWTRELYGKDYICAIDRKPDPRVEVCLSVSRRCYWAQIHLANVSARDADKKDPGRMQILHYNIDRFPDEIKDLRGLETLLVASYVAHEGPA